MIGLLIFQIPLYLKKSLSELKSTSVIMFIAICSLIGVLAIKNITNDTIVDTSEGELPISNSKLADACNISITSYGFFNKMFPVFSEMENSTYKNRMLTVFLA